jgi:stress response protein YsnF
VLIRQERERLQARLEAIKKEEAEVQKALQENAERAAEAISVEEASISLLEQQEATAGPSNSLAMSPFT